MSTLHQARAALAIAKSCHTKAAWQAAALAFASLAESTAITTTIAPTAVVALAPKRKRASAGERHQGKTPLRHVIRCTLADGYSARVTIGQFKGDTIQDALARMERFTLASWRSDQATRAGHRPFDGLAFNAAMAALVAPGVAELRVVKYATGARAG